MSNKSIDKLIEKVKELTDLVKDGQERADRKDRDQKEQIAKLEKKVDHLEHQVVAKISEVQVSISDVDEKIKICLRNIVPCQAQICSHT